MENKFAFDSVNHAYCLEGMKIPGVTEILRSVGYVDYSWANPGLLEAAQKFGIAGHKMCELWDLRILDISTLDLHLMPYLEGYRKFLDSYKPEIMTDWIEKPAYSPKWRFGFTLDRVAAIDHKLTIYEIKFVTAIQEATAIQLGGYKIGFEDVTGLKIKQRWGVQILPGNFKVEPYTDMRDERAFLNALGVHNEKIRRGLWKR